MRKAIKVLLVDDHPVVREGLRSSLGKQDQFVVVGEACNGEEAVRLGKELSPDIILMDINLPGMNGIEATARLRKIVPKAKILAITVHKEKEYILEMMRAGAKGYVSKESSPSDLYRAIETVHRGDTHFDPHSAQVLAKDYVTSPELMRESAIPKISRRETEVLALLADGFINKQIAYRLQLSVRTVETHRERIKAKLDIHTVAELTKYAIANGITMVT